MSGDSQEDTALEQLVQEQPEPDDTGETTEESQTWDVSTEEDTEETVESLQPGQFRTNRTRGLELIAAATIAFALLLGSGAAVLVAVPLIVTIIYHRVTGLPAVELSATRAFSQVSVMPGDTVTVEVTVTNEGETSIADLRIRDEVPDRLTVTEGTTMGSFSLEPGGSATLSYKVIARRGRHDFATVEAICRNTSGSERHQLSLAAERTLVAEVSLERTPIDSQASQYTGRLETSFRGSGVEFYSTREYHPSDSPRDIDWRTFAKTSEFTTIEYKDTRAASIHLVVDRREEAREQAGPNGVTTAEMCLYAAEHVAENLIEDRHQVGVTTVGDHFSTHYPKKGPDQYRRVRQEFRNGDDEETRFRGLDDSLADDFVGQTESHTQFVCLTGLYDDGFDDFLDRLVKHDRSVLVISPRHEMVDTPGAKLTFLQREIRIDKLRRQGINVLDWDTDEPLRLAIERRLGGLGS